MSTSGYGSLVMGTYFWWSSESAAAANIVFAGSGTACQCLVPSSSWLLNQLVAFQLYRFISADKTFQVITCWSGCIVQVWVQVQATFGNHSPRLFLKAIKGFYAKSVARSWGSVLVQLSQVGSKSTTQVVSNSAVVAAGSNCLAYRKFLPPLTDLVWESKKDFMAMETEFV